MSNKPPLTTVQGYLNDVLSELLDHFDGALILVRNEQGGAIVVAGGSSASGQDAEAYRELIQAAPGIIRAWRDEADLVDATGARPAGELN